MAHRSNITEMYIYAVELAAKNKSKGLYLVAEVAAASDYYIKRNFYALVECRRRGLYEMFLSQ